MPTVELRMSEDANEGTEASLARWLKQPGDRVTEHEPLVEISTDKVTLEIAAPVSGVLAGLLKQAGDAVLPGDLLGRIEVGSAMRTMDAETESNASPGKVPVMQTTATPQDRATFSPVVRRLLSELGLDPQSIPKVGRGGRLNPPEDIGAYLRSGPRDSASTPRATLEQGPAGRRVPHTPMRRSIAAHMARSVQTAPHVTSVFEADLFNVLADREARRQMQPGLPPPSVTAYLIYAAVEAIRQVPDVNSRWHEDWVEVFEQVNFGVGTALQGGGLVVPVLRDAQKMDLAQIAQALGQMTGKARAGKLAAADMAGGTFTLSNHGVGGSLLAAPIILPHGQAAILGAGKMQKRVIVCETGGRELFRVRPMMYVTLTVDHRVLDAQQTNAFLTALVRVLESPPRQEPA